MNLIGGTSTQIREKGPYSASIRLVDWINPMDCIFSASIRRIQCIYPMRGDRSSRGGKGERPRDLDRYFSIFLPTSQFAVKQCPYGPLLRREWRNPQISALTFHYSTRTFAWGLEVPVLEPPLLAIRPLSLSANAAGSSLAPSRSK